VSRPGKPVGSMQAFRMVTIDTTYTLGTKDKSGSIENGKFADFADLAVADDPFEVPIEKIREIKVWGDEKTLVAHEANSV
jgi:predicted amidohydrolase YtcJ